MTFATLIIILAVTLSRISFGQPHPDESLVVETGSGSVRGLRAKTTENGTEFWKFLSIPYAEPPTGRLRFQDPEPKIPWRHVHNATEFGPMCPQLFLKDVVGHEDCLKLNIFTPSVPSKSPWRVKKSALNPVLVFIHGGGFMFGTSQQYRPDTMIDRGVVFVTLNYRLGPLGFLSLSNQLISGNMGLKDQLLALEWIHANIEHFGGDPDRITISGESAGAMSVHAHLISPHGSGLYQGAIAQSGSILITHEAMKSRKYEKYSEVYVEDMKCGNEYNMSQTLRCLQDLPLEILYPAPETNIFSALDLVNYQLASKKTTMMFSPVNDFYAKKPFLPILPLQSLVQKKVKDIPVIAGVTAHEGSTFIAPFLDRIEELNEDEKYKYLILNFFRYMNAFDVGEREKQFAEQIRHFYMKDKDFSLDNFETIIDMNSDLLFFSAVYEAYQYQAAIAKSPVYLYELVDKPNEGSFATLFAQNKNGSVDFGVAHGDDLCFLFNVDGSSYEATEPLQLENDDKKTANAMLAYWANFVSYHDPSPNQIISPEQNISEWIPMKNAIPENVNVMELGPEPKIRSGFHSKRMRFLEEHYWTGEISEQLVIKEEFEAFKKFQMYFG